jgi:lipopolysaccharide biosynthesis regulator YciM
MRNLDDLIFEKQYYHWTSLVLTYMEDGLFDQADHAFIQLKQIKRQWIKFRRDLRKAELCVVSSQQQD